MARPILALAAVALCACPPGSDSARESVAPSSSARAASSTSATAPAPPTAVATATTATADRKPPAPAAPPAPAITLPKDAPHLASILRAVALSQEPTLTEQQRLKDLVAKTGKALAALKLSDLGAVRAKALEAVNDPESAPSWMTFRRGKTDSGDPVDVELTIRVWLPANARSIPAFSGPLPIWSKNPTQNLPERSGNVWFCERLSDVNEKSRYRPGTLSFRTYALHAPFAWLLFEHLYREGVHDVARRVPIMAVRSGEDCYSADRTAGPVVAESASFVSGDLSDFQTEVSHVLYPSHGDVAHATHRPRSSHRIGCALDINDFSFHASNDGATNPVSRSPRHAARDRMHAVDARNLPSWVYDAAKQMGYRIPTDWNYAGGKRDWPHLDLGGR